MQTYSQTTGASGVLGSAVYAAFKASQDNVVLGLAHSRPKDDLKVVDLLNEYDTEALIGDFKPDCEEP